MATHTLRGLFSAIADAIRAKTGESSDIVADVFPTAIAAIVQGYSAGDWGDPSKPTGRVVVDKAYTSADVTTCEYMFYRRTGITAIEFPNAICLPEYICFKCDNLASVKAPNLERISYYSLGQTGIQSISLPSIVDIRPGAFFGCGRLRIVDLGGPNVGSPSNWGNNAFVYAGSVDTLIIRHTTVFPIATIGAVTVGTEFAQDKTGGTIYIPQSLYDHLGDGTADDYKAATNWSTIDGYGTITWKSIESTHTDPDAPIDLTLYYADGTLIPTE